MALKLRLKEVAAQRKMSMYQISIETGIATSTLSRINNGNQSPSIDLLDKIATALKVNVAELLVSDEEYLECPYCHKLIRVHLDKKK